MRNISDVEKTKIDKMTASAKAIMRSGEKDRGKQKINEIISEFPENEYSYSSAAAVYWELNMFTEAKKSKGVKP